MKKLLCALCTIFVFCNIYAAWDAEKTNTFLSAMERAADPDNAGKSIKTMEISGESIIKQLNIKITTNVFYKTPDKLKSVSISPLQTTTLYFNGKKGIKDDSIGGVSPVEGIQLKELEMQAKRLNPALPLRQAYSKIEIQDEPEERNGKKYVVLICSDDASGLFPQKVLVDPDTKLIAYVTGKFNSDMGVVEITTHYIKYSKINGLMLPVKFVQSMMNIEIEVNVAKFIVNKKYPDSMFEYQEQ